MNACCDCRACCDPATPALLQGFCTTVGCDFDEYMAFKVSWKALFVASKSSSGAEAGCRSRARWQGGSSSAYAVAAPYLETWRD